MESLTRAYPPPSISYTSSSSRVILDVTNRIVDHGKSPIPRISSPVTPSSTQSPEGIIKTDEVDSRINKNNDNYIPAPEDTHVLEDTPTLPRVN